MPNIETYYLVDFENVNDAGLACSNQLGNHDHILIFSTKNAPKISIESLSTFNSIDFSSYNIPVGKQSVDLSKFFALVKVHLPSKLEKAKFSF